MGYLGELVIVIDFETGDFDGMADSFLSVENIDEYAEADINNSDFTPRVGGAVDGQLTLTGSQAPGTLAGYEIVIDGRLDASDGSFLEFDEVGGDVNVYGDGAATLEVLGEAGATFDGGPGYIGVSGLARR